jgi:hypothetical protein
VLKHSTYGPTAAAILFRLVPGSKADKAQRGFSSLKQEPKPPLEFLCQAVPLATGTSWAMRLAGTT